MRRRISFVAASGALAFLLHSVPAEATIFTWKLAGSGLTSLNTNWSPLGVPGADDDTRFLQNGITYTITTHSPADTFTTVTASGSGNPQFSCGDPLRIGNTFLVNGGVTASIISGVARAGAFNVGPGTFTITGNGTQAIATNAVLTNVFGSGSGTSTVNVNGGAALTGGYFEMPSVASATAILNISDHPAGGSPSLFQGAGLYVGYQGTGDAELSAGANILMDEIFLGMFGAGRLHQFTGPGPVAPPSMVVNLSTTIGDNTIPGQLGGQGTLAIDAGEVDFKGPVSLGDPDGGGQDTLRMTGGSVLAENGLTLNATDTSILDLQGGSLRVLGNPSASSKFGLEVNQAVPLSINGPGAGPTLTLAAGEDSITTATPLSLVVGHDAAGTLNVRGDPRSLFSLSDLIVLGDAAVADQSTGIGFVDVDSAGQLEFRGSLSVGPGNGTIRLRDTSGHASGLGVTKWADVLSGPSTGGSIQVSGSCHMTAVGGVAINGTKDSPSSGNAVVSVDSRGLLMWACPLQIWSGGHLIIGGVAAVDTGVVMGEIQMVGGELDSSNASSSEVVHLRNGGSLHGVGIVRHRIVLDDSTATIGTLTGDTLSGSPSKLGTLAGGSGSLTVGDSTGTAGIVLGGMVRVEKDTLCLLNQGVLDLGPHVILSGGTLNVPHGGHVGPGGVVEGYGTLTGDITVDGTVKATGALNLGGTLNVPVGGEISASGIVSGFLTLGGRLDMGSTLARLELANAPTLQSTCAITMRIGSAVHGAQDTLMVDQPLSLSGALDLRTWKPDPSMAGDTLILISAPSISGSFSAVTIDGVNAPSYVQVIYEPTRVRVAVLQTTVSVSPPSPRAMTPVVLRLAPAGTMVDPSFALDLPRAAEVQLSVYNVAGRRTTELVSGRLEPGRYRFPFQGAAPGVYFGEARIKDAAGEKVLSARVVRVR